MCEDLGDVVSQCGTVHVWRGDLFMFPLVRKLLEKFSF